MACVYKYVNENGIVVELNDQEFDSSIYDLIVKENLDAEEYLRQHPELIFSVNKYSETVEKVKSIEQSISQTLQSTFGFEGSDPDTAEKLHNAPGYIGITSLITKYGNPKKGINHPIVSEFVLSNWELNKRKELLSSGLTETQIDAIIKDTEDSWEILQKYGDDIHAIYEAIFRGSNIPDSKNLPKDLVDEVIKQASEFKAELIRKYSFGDPSKVQFFPELSISAKDVDPDLKTLLEHDGIHHVSGTIDLLVIDAKGNAHIYDYKTSRKILDPDDWSITRNSVIDPNHWHSSKKLSVKNQLAAYKCMLEQYGIKNATCEVVPIYLDIEYTDQYKSTISKLNSVTRQKEQIVPETSNGEVYGNWKSLLPVKIFTTAEETTQTANKFQKLFPTEHVSALHVQQFEANVEYYRNKVKNVTSDDTEHFGRYQYYFIKHETNGLREYARDDEDLTEKLEDYVSKVREKKSNELHALANTLTHALSGQITLEEFVNDYNISDKNFLLTQFSRYIKEGWDLISDDNMIGMGLFLFQHDGRSEMVVIANQPLHNVINLGRGKSILGRTLEDTYVDSKDILPASNGNMEAMKAMVYISDHPELFASNKLTQLVVLNPWRAQRTYVNNSQWIYNYNRLIDNVENNGEFQKINSDVFYDDIVSLLSIVDSNLKSAETAAELKGFSLNGMLQADGSVTQFTEEYVKHAIDWMRAKYEFLANAENEMLGNQNVWMAYNYLNQTLLALKGLRIYSELEPGEWMSAGIKAGLAVSSPGYSPSTNFRVFDDIIQQYTLDVRLAVEKQGRPIITSLMKFYKAKGQVKIVGGEAEYFKEWFVTENGKITDEFRLKDPNSPDFDGSPESREALDVWLKTMAELRWPKSDFRTEQEWESNINRMKASGEYYQVPLTEAAFSRQVKGVGLLQTVKNKWAQYRELTEDVFAGQTEEKERWRKERHWELYNKFNKSATERQKLIEEHGVGFFETNLEDVINQALVAYNKTRLSRKYIPIIDAMRVSIRCAQSYGGANMEETLRSFDKLVKSKFYGESIIDKSLQPYARWIQVLKSGFSKLQLGFNFRSFFRELFQGTWMGLSRSGVELMPGVNIDTYTNGALHVVTQAHKNFSNVSLLQQLNSQYGMANYSLGQIARQRRMNWWGIKNFRSDTLFLTSSAPDFQHRMAILVAKMMGDGCWEAHSLDENGFVKYDFTKDSRFSVYLSGDTKNKEYIAQKSNYLARIAALNEQGITKEDGSQYKEGDALPMAYLPREVQSIKNFADLLYGHYDDESKSLMNDMLLGSMFLQYKTYVTSRVEQWTITEGVYNTTLLQQDTDPINGEGLYKYHKGLDEYGMPIIEIKTLTQLENDGVDIDSATANNQIEACMVWKGIPMEGMARSYFKFAKDVKELNWADLKEKWDNPIERDNVLIGLHDCLFMSLMMLLVTGLFGMIFDGKWTTDRTEVARSMQKHGWGPSFMYNVAYGSFSDFPFWQSVGSMFNDLNPPVVISAKRLVENTGAVVVGDKTVAQALTNTIGAAADLRGWANKLAKAAEQV